MNKRILAAAALLVPAAALAQAQPAQQPAPAAKPVTRADVVKELDAAFARIDTNRDGAILKAEADAAQQRAAQQGAATSQRVAEQQFAQLDSDKNGQLSLVEFKAAAVRPRIVPGQQAINVLDANKDQKVTLAEFRARRLAQFDTLDADRDGIVVPQEVQAAARRR